MARDLLEVADNFERALKSFPEAYDDKIKEFHEGIILTEKSLHQVLNRFDVTVIDASVTKFDPNLHEAITQIPVADKQAGDIIDVIRKGYKMGDRLLRAAQVVTVA
jgi:molecular chaperone GrpE